MPRIAAVPLIALAAAATLLAHPMGNFSISHYARFEARAQSAGLLYVLDLAEIPTFELAQEWKLDPRTSRRQELDAKVSEQARKWAANLAITVDGKPVPARFESAKVTVADGAGNMPVMRIESRLAIPAQGGSLAYEDRNFSERAGWKEIVVVAGEGAHVLQSSAATEDRSYALTAYPADPTVAPPQDVRAAFRWTGAAPVVSRVTPPAPAPQPAVTQVSPVPPQPQAAGTVVRGDFLSTLLSRKEIPFTMVLMGIAVAFGLGAVHALSPGHGKTLVAAYLVGSRGTLKHAMFLGAMTTFTHTISVFLLGLATLFLSQYIVPEKVFPYLGAISGLSIVFIGMSLFWKRWKKMREHGHAHSHHHHAHDHDHAHAHAHAHAAHSHDHHHGPGGHSHVPEGDITLGSLIALGASGGLVPCPSALVLLLSAIALGRTGLGLLLLVGFSLGLSVVLMAIGGAVLYAKNLLPDGRKTAQHPAFRLVPVLSAAIIVIIGCIMTGVSLGWVRPERLIG